MAWQPLDGRMIASLLVRRTLVVQGGRQLYLLPSGSAYQESSGYLSYQRWGVLGNRLCLQDRQRYCYEVARAPSGLLRVTDRSGRSGLARLLDGDPNRLVRRYGLSLRSALQKGQVRLARRSGDSVLGMGSAPSVWAQRSTPFAPRRPSLAPAYQAPAYQAPAYQAPAYQAPAYQAPRFGRSGDPVAKDGTVGRFAIRPQGQPSILPNAASSADTGSGAPTNSVASTAPDSTRSPTQQGTAALQAQPQAGQATTGQVTKGQATKVQDLSARSILFSEVVDRDPGCYAQRQRCLSRCQGGGQSLRSKAHNPNRCSTNCLDTYICTR